MAGKRLTIVGKGGTREHNVPDVAVSGEHLPQAAGVDGEAPTDEDLAQRPGQRVDPCSAVVVITQDVFGNKTIASPDMKAVVVTHHDLNKAWNRWVHLAMREAAKRQAAAEAAAETPAAVETAPQSTE